MVCCVALDLVRLWLIMLNMTLLTSSISSVFVGHTNWDAAYVHPDSNGLDVAAMRWDKFVR